VLLFLEHVGERERAERAFRRVGALLLDNGHVSLDPQTSGYVHMPLDYAPSPHSLCRRLFDDATVATHLDALAHKQQADGGWSIAWPAVSPTCELEYRGVVTLNALKTLNAYGYLR
jgi:hypothetical protein